MPRNTNHICSTRNKTVLVQFFIIAAAFSLLVPVTADAQTQWTIAPYLWGPNLTFRGDINNLDAVDRTLRFGTTLDETDFAGMLYLEGKGQHYGAFLDTTYFNLGDQRATLQVNPLPPLTVPSELIIDSKFTLVDVAGFYRPAGGSEGLDVYLGARIADIDLKYDARYPNGSSNRVFQVSSTLGNGIAGIRYTKSFGPKWDFSGKADAGAGDAEFTWLAQATAGYWFGDDQRMSLRFGYRYTEMKFENDEEENIDLDSKIELGGPLVGFLFRF